MDTGIGDRIAKLRTAKGVSARDMSLSLGQGVSYINQIENHQALPSIKALFYICEYLNVSPKDFFDESMEYPPLVNELLAGIKPLNEQSLLNLIGLVKQIKTK